MTAPARQPASRRLFGPAEAARRLGVSIKALRLHERHGLIRPRRDGKGWRVYTEEDLDRLAGALAFQAMGFSLAQIATLLDAGAAEVSAALAAQEAVLRARQRALEDALAAVRDARRTRTALRLVA